MEPATYLIRVSSELLAALAERPDTEVTIVMGEPVDWTYPAKETILGEMVPHDLPEPVYEPTLTTVRTDELEDMERGETWV